jgi:flagellar protein FliJ
MTKSKRMQPVARVADQRERQAAVEMAEFRRFLDAQQAKLDELNTYRNDYARHFEQAGRGGMDAARMADYRRILARLNDAIAYQEKRLISLHSDYEQVRRRWTDTRTRAAALDKVMERYRSDERRAEDRREQGELDERSQHVGSGHSGTKET